MEKNRDSEVMKGAGETFVVRKKREGDLVIALAGNPNVGKSTVFNQLTGMKQHTGNWPGKTVSNAQGYCTYEGKDYVLVDLPGCYSLFSHSAEEEIARDYICFGRPDAVVIVCDAVCLERNMNLVLQVLEVTDKAVVCVNLMDEAAKKGIRIDLSGLEKELGVPVVGTAARSGRGLEQILDRLGMVLGQGKESRDRGEDTGVRAPLVRYPDYIEKALDEIGDRVRLRGNLDPLRWVCARILDGDDSFLDSLCRLGLPGKAQASGFFREELLAIRRDMIRKLKEEGMPEEALRDGMAGAFVATAERICRSKIVHENSSYGKKDRVLDYLFTSRLTGFPIMFVMLLLIFWITITGANYPSDILSRLLFGFEETLWKGAAALGIPELVSRPLIDGMYRVLAWVVSVMLPPMAIFFPMFTLLEDFGYLPRVAFNLDKCFQKCFACGKQALTMCMVEKGMRPVWQVL